MLDFDLAELYQVETRRLNEQVKRNIERFPKDFMFRLTLKEWQFIQSQNATASAENIQSQNATASQKKRNISAIPYAFTEHGVTMLASVLKSGKAVKMNIAIVRAFVALKEYAMLNKGFAQELERIRKDLSERISEHDTQLNHIYNALENLLDKDADKELQKREWEARERIGFKK